MVILIRIITPIDLLSHKWFWKVFLFFTGSSTTTTTTATADVVPELLAEGEKGDQEMDGQDLEAASLAGQV